MKSKKNNSKSLSIKYQAAKYKDKKSRNNNLKTIFKAK